jgi:hypothetical protein
MEVESIDWNASLSLWFIFLEGNAGRLEMQLQPDAKHHSRVSSMLVRTNSSLGANCGKFCLVLTNQDGDA